MTSPYDALLLVSFGGPERPDEVMPFLENVARGRRIPRERLEQVAEHYYHFGGRSPINDQNRALMAALRELLEREGPALPLYWGNRNWHPFLADAVRQMKEDGIRRAAAFITSAFGSYSGCRQYLDDIDRARTEVGSGAPEILRLPVFGSNPGFIEPMVENVRAGLAQFATPPHIAFTAHSIPTAMADASPYVRQLDETCRIIAGLLRHDDWRLVYQSRSGPPQQPWLGPDILDYMRERHAMGFDEIVVAPVGFISDHMEVVYDLDTEAAGLARELGLKVVRTPTVGTHPRFVRMIRDLLFEAPHDCALDCCPAPQRVG
jgi:ferrochelatase